MVQMNKIKSFKEFIGESLWSEHIKQERVRLVLTLF